MPKRYPVGKGKGDANLASLTKAGDVLIEQQRVGRLGILRAEVREVR